MKKLLLTLLALSVLALAAGAQSLLENPDYLKSLELKAQAAQAFDQGDYDGAAELAAQAKDYASRSDAYVEKMIAKSRADRALAEAKESMAKADAAGARERHPDEYGEAAGHYQLGVDYYGNEVYPDSEQEARAAIDSFGLLADLMAREDEEAAKAAADSLAKLLPATYAVRRFATNTDCLWRIAGYPFVYNDPYMWPKLYEANKKLFREPANPDLVVPGQILKIPSIRGEERKGAWNPAKKYIPLPKK